jgi:hypothetical protein
MERDAGSEGEGEGGYGIGQESEGVDRGGEGA